MAGNLFPDFCRYDNPLTMGENHRIDPFAATHAAPVVGTEFVHRLWNHKAATAMAAIDVHRSGDGFS